jgi:hypothetical protein
MARVKQVADPAPIEVRGSEVHGKGVFAGRQLKKGERIVEYLGERVSHDEADRRYEEKDENDSHTFLFIVDSKTVIDAGTDGNDARYFNHSCDPNCESVVENRRVFIEALRTIEPGEEMTYDYQIYREEGDPENIDEVFACRCGFPQCRGTMLWPPEPKKKKKKSKASGKSKSKSKSSARDKSAAAGKQGAAAKRAAAGKSGKQTSVAGKQGKSGKTVAAGKSGKQGKSGKTSVALKTGAAGKKSSGAGKKSTSGGKSGALGKSAGPGGKAAAGKQSAAGKRSGPGKTAAQKSGPAKSASKAGKKSVRRR